MSIRKTIIVTAAIAASVAMVAPSFVGAVTIEELQAQINALLAQLATLQGTSTTTSGSVPAACVGVTFTRNMTVGATGSDVKCLQALMNNNGYTVATSGAGSPGNETTYFGSKTLAAVKAFQAAKGWTPANQVGPLTRNALNALLGGTTGTPTTPIVVPTGAGLTVQLAYDNPASRSVVTTEGLAPLAKFTFVNGDNAAVKVTNLKVTRIGISADASLSNVYLLQGATRLTDGASVSSGLITFNDSTGLFTVPAGSSVTITVAADLAASAGETVGVQIASASNVTTNASSVKGTYPISGNLMTAATASLATVTFGSSTSSPSTNTSLDPQNDYPIWQNSTVVGTRSVKLTRIAFRLIGSVYQTDLQNFRLNIDGVQVGSAVSNMDSNGYVTFDLSSAPVSLNTGTRLIKVLADIVNGSSRNFYTSIRVAADANFVDSQYGVNVAPYSTSGSSSFVLADVTTGTQTIASGTVTFVKATDSPSGDIVNTASNALLAKYTISSAGEPVKITDLYVRAYFTNVSGTQTVDDDCAGSSTVCTSASYMKLRNGMLYANGVQVGSTTALSPAAAGTHFTLGSSLIVTPGSPVTLEVRADIYDETGTYNDVDATDTVYAEIVSTASNAQATISLSTVTTPSTNVDGNTLTVAAGSLTLSKYTAYTNQTIVPPVTAYKLGHFTLTSSATESTNLNTIYVDLTTNTTVVKNLYVKYGTQQTTAIASPSATTLANSYSINYSLPAGQTIDIQVYGDVNSLATTSVYTSVYVTGTTGSSATAVTTNSGSVLPGQTVTFGTGSINGVVDGTTPSNAIVAGNQSVVAGKFKFTASNDNYTITQLAFLAQDANSAACDSVIQSATLYDGSTALGTVAFNGTGFYFTGLNVSVAANTTKVLTLQYLLATPSTNQYIASGSVVTTGLNPIATLEYMKTLNSSGVMHDAGGGTVVTPGSTNSAVTIASSTGGTSAANYVYVYKSVPTFANGSVSGQGAALTAGSSTNLYNFSITADAKGSVAIKQLKFPITINDVNNGTPPTTTARVHTFRLFRGSTDLYAAGLITILNTSEQSLLSTSYSISTSGTAVVIFNTEEVIPAGSTYTYTLKATPAGFACASGTCDSISTALTGSTDSVPAESTAGYKATSYFLDASSASTDIQKLDAAVGQNGSGGTDYDVIWSDNSAKSHSYTVGSSTAGSGDWFNGYLVPGLPLDSIGVVAQ